jgi:Uncharacterised nucleotidyltransferase
MATRDGLTGSFWPSEAQQLLLRAVLLEGEAGDEAWRALRPSFDSQRFESGSLGLLALLYERRGADDHRLARLKGVRRFLWYQDQVGIEALRDALQHLRERDVPTIVLGGAALIERYYGRLGVCPLVEPGVLVPPDSADVAADVLVEAGFRPSAQRSGRRQSYTRDRGQSRWAITVHWRLAPELDPLTDATALDAVWSAAKPGDVQGIPARALSAADELLATCVVGARSRPRADFQWIVDAVTIMRAPGSSVDWQRLVTEATSRRCALRLRDALAFLVDVLEAPVPRATLDALAAVPATRRERFAHELAGRGARFAGNLPATLAAHLVSAQDESLPQLVLGLPRFLGAEWGVESPSQFPGAVARRVAASLSAARTRRHSPS